MTEEDDYIKLKKEKKTKVETKQFHPVKVTITMFIFPTIIFFFIFALMPEISRKIFKVGTNSYSKRKQELALIIEQNKLRYESINNITENNLAHNKNNGIEILNKKEQIETNMTSEINAKTTTDIKKTQETLNSSQVKNPIVDVNEKVSNKNKNNQKDNDKKTEKEKTDIEIVTEKIQLDKWMEKISADKYE